MWNGEPATAGFRTGLNTGGGKDEDGGLDKILRDCYETEMERKQDAKNCVWKSEWWVLKFKAYKTDADWLMEGGQGNDWTNDLSTEFDVREKLEVM